MRKTSQDLRISEPAEQLGQLDVERGRDLEQGRHARARLGPLDLRQERHRQLGPARHLLEGQAAGLAQLADRAADGGVQLATYELRTFDGENLRPLIAPEIADVPNQPHLLIERGDLTVPVAHVWNRADKNSCYDTSMACPLPDGSTATMGAAECRHLPLREAIAAQGASSRSKDFRVCVEGDNTAIACDRHVVTGVTNGVNTDPSTSADYNSAVFAWVKARMADD